MRLAALALVLAVLAGGGCSQRAPGGAVLLWHHYHGDERRALEEVVAEEKRRGGVEIHLVHVPYDGFIDKVTNAIPNGNGPDLFLHAHDRIGDWALTRLIEPVEYYVDEELADRYAYDALAALAYGDSLYGLPVAVKSAALYYRTDLVAAPPATTDELIALGAELRARGPTRDDVYALVYENTVLYYHAAWLHGFGGRVFGEDGELAIDSPEAVRALELARDLRRRHRVVPADTSATLVATLFNEGKAALAISGPWFSGDIAAGVPYGIAPLPVVSETGEPAMPFLGTDGVLMSARARDKDAAFAAMRALASDRSALARARGAGQIVPNHAAYDEPDVGGDPTLSAFRAQLERSVPMPATPEMRQVWDPAKRALQKAIDEGADPAAALSDAAREIRTYLDGARR